MSGEALAPARGRLLALKARFDAGEIDAARYNAERIGIERELSDALLGAASESAAMRPSQRLLASLAAAVVVLAIAGYALTGSPSLAGFGPARTGAAATADTAAATPDHAASNAAGLQQIATMVDALAVRMKSRPDDAQGWAMLARSYTVLGRFADALPAYRHASELQPNNANLLADYADVTAATKGSIDNPESVALIERVLAVDPNHPKALALAGTVAFDRGDFAGAIAHWQKIVETLPPDSELAKQVQAGIVEARAKAGSAAGGPAQGVLAAATAAPPMATAATPAVATGGTSVSGTVSIAPALASRAAPDDTVFVFARPAEGSRMPLAILRARVADLPLEFRLDDSMAMTPNAKISAANSIIVGARVTKSGNAVAQAGDLAGESAPVAPGATGIGIRIGEVVGSR